MDLTMSEVTKAETPNRETTHAGRNTIPKALSCAIFIVILAVCYYHSNKLVKELAKLEARVDALTKAVGDGGGGDGHDPNIMLVKKLAKVEDGMDALIKALKDSGEGHDSNDMLSKKLVELEEQIDAVSKALKKTDQKWVNVHGAWGTWASWTSCSSSCGTGITHRTRECDNPRPSLLGNYCFGESSEYGLCTAVECPVNGHWTDWTIWSGCSITCGNGLKTRQRYCLNPAPANGGSACTGSTTAQTSCNVMSCPVNGQWSSWTSWSTCYSNICSGTGLSHRHRTCSNPPPSSSGQGCIGDSTSQRICSVTQCDGQVRLVNGTQRSGRIEILYQGIWGTICDDSWDKNDAKVVCRMLGYSGGIAYGDAHFGQGLGRITLDEVRCTGSESTLTACSNAGWLKHNCYHTEDAGVSCT